MRYHLGGSAAVGGVADRDTPWRWFSRSNAWRLI